MENKILVRNIKGFKEYFFKEWHNEEDFRLNYLVFWELSLYIKRKFLNKNYDVLWDNKELDNIISIIFEIYKKGNEDVKGDIIYWFLDGLFIPNDNKFNKLKKIIKYKELQKELDKTYESWNKNAKYRWNPNKKVIEDEIERAYITLKKLKEIEEKKLENIWREERGSSNVLLNEVVKLLNYDLSFGKFLEDKGWDDENWIPYAVFGHINRYIKDCYEKKEYDKIQHIFKYLDNMALSENKEIKDLLLAWNLENLDNFKDILPDLVSMMPKNLKEVFLRVFSDYLK